MDNKEISANPDTSSSTTDFNNRQPPPAYKNLSGIDATKAQPEYAQPGYAQPPYAQPQYAQPQFAPPQYNQASYVVGAPDTAVVGTAMVATGVSLVIMQPQLGSKPTTVHCKTCSQEIVTKVDYTTYWMTHLVAGVACLFGCWCCIPIPYFVNACKKADHYCPSCGAFIGFRSA